LVLVVGLLVWLCGYGGVSRVVGCVV